MNGERLTFFLDVDNTLLDNDAAKARMAERLREIAGDAEAERFWTLYELIRRETGVVGVPETLARWDETTPPDASIATDHRQRRVRLFAMAEVLFEFPYPDYLFPGAIAAIDHLKTLGKVAILSEGDPAYQASKIVRSGLADAADGHVIVCPTKSRYLREATTIMPADRYVLVEDKPTNIDLAREIVTGLGHQFSGVFVRQGKYAAVLAETPWSGAEVTVDQIGDLVNLSPGQLRLHLAKRV